MMNLPLHRKYRPNTIMRYIGNQKNKTSITRALEKDKRPQVILLYGNSGCGKTSLARLIAKEYQCEDRDINTGACCKCSNCMNIDKYIETGETDWVANIKEIDIADQSGKNDLADVLEDMQIPTFNNEWKVYILDEIQEASKALQNRLLKIAEEPPERVVLIFCTTNPEKLLDTLKSRCQLRLNIQKPKDKELYQLLKYVCDSEKIEWEPKGISQLVQNSDLVIRTALQNLEQVHTEQGSITQETVSQVFSQVTETTIIEFFKALKNKDTFKYITTLNEIKLTVDLNTFFTQLKNFVRKGIYIINGVNTEEISENDLVVYRNLFADLGVAQVAFLLGKLLSLNENNLELELIMLGYTGLDIELYTESNKEKEQLIPVVENEIAIEEKTAKKAVERQEEIKYEQALNNTNKVMEEASIESILAMGGVLVDNF